MSSRKSKLLRKNIGKRIKIGKNFRNYSDATMTKKMKFKSPTDYSNLEKGSSLTIENLLKIATILDINFMWLIAGDDYDMKKFIKIPTINKFEDLE